MPLGTPQDIRLLQSLESSLPLIDSPAPGPGVFPLATYTDAIDNSYCTSYMSVCALGTSVLVRTRCRVAPTLTCCAVQVRGSRSDLGRCRLRQRFGHRLSRSADLVVPVAATCRSFGPGRRHPVFKTTCAPVYLNAPPVE